MQRLSEEMCFVLAKATHREACHIRGVCTQWRQLLHRADLWKTLSGLDTCIDEATFKLLFNQELLRNGSLFALRDYPSDWHGGETPLLWTGDLLVETEPHIGGLANQHCPGARAGKPTSCLCGHNGWHKMQSNVWLNGLLLEDANGEWDRYAEKELRRSGYESFSEIEFNMPPTLLSRSPALLLSVWVAGRDDWRGAFSLFVQVMGAESKRRKKSLAYDPTELLTVLTKAAWAPSGSWRKVNLLILKPLASPCAVNVQLTTIGASNGNGCWRANGQTVECDSLFPGDGEAISAKLAYASLRWIPQCDVLDTVASIRESAKRQIQGSSDPLLSNCFDLKGSGNIPTAGVEYDSTVAISDVIPAPELDFSSRAPDHEDSEEDFSDY